MHMTEPEGTYIGRCITVLAGGRSGGHNGAVLGAVSGSIAQLLRSYTFSLQAWHPNPNIPLIATCGVS